MAKLSLCLILNKPILFKHTKHPPITYFCLMNNVVVIGVGAAGLFAAISCDEANLELTVLML